MSGKRSAQTPQIPTKWAVLVVACLIGYALAQPLLNRGLGWQLPSLAAILGEGPPQPGRQDRIEAAEEEVLADASQRSEASIGLETPAANDRIQDSSRTRPTDTQAEFSDEPVRGKLRYGLLTEIGPDDYLSPGGLRYTRGSEEGHRLAHLERHLQDDPARPGKHGVFDGDMPQVLRWLDEAYALAKRGAKGTSADSEGDRTIYEARFPRPIGFVGGRDGKRANNPDARSVRIVVEGNRVITAFPF